MPLQCTCPVCGKTFYADAYAVNVQKRRACSRTCRGIIRSATQKQDPAVRFWRRVNKAEECWTWTGGLLIGGHGAFNDGERPLAAHRYAWILATGDALTRSDAICHTCDHPACVRNDDEGTYTVRGVEYPRRGHLFKATSAINTIDMVEKGRHRNGGPLGGGRGEANVKAKLTAADVRAIRAARAAGETGIAIAKQYGVTPAMISAIVRLRNWRHVE